MALSGSGEKLISAEQEERNRRAFEAWLMRKQDERKEHLTAQRQALKAADLERMEEEKKLISARAYQQWLLNKQQEDQQRKKEQRVEREYRNLCDVERKMHLERAKADFASWKKRKDFERTLNAREPVQEVEDMGRIATTPPLPGYCSVWSCDEELAQQMVTRVQRPS